ASDRKVGEFRRYKQLEVPRKCQKTSTVSKAYVTQESLRQFFIFSNIYFRVILTSATSTLTTQLLRAYKGIWAKNLNIKRLYGTDVTRGYGNRQYLERIGMLDRNCKAGHDAIAFRWLSNASDSTGKAAFNVMVAGVQTETTGQRADLYIFDDPATAKNSNTASKRDAIRALFSEQCRQLEHTGRMIVCNTRKHLEDFGGMIGKEPFRSRFFSLHRKAEWVDPVTGLERLYYPVDGEGEEQLSRQELDRLRASMPEREYSSEYLNEPLDPSRALFRREDFQIIDPSRAPIEVRYGLGRELTDDEKSDLLRERADIVAYNHCDPAGKEEQSAKGDDSAIVGWRRDRYGSVYFTYLRSGQFTSSQLWDQLYLAFCYNRPLFTDYEKADNDLHTPSAYRGWCARKQLELDAEAAAGHIPSSADIRPRFEKVSKANKNSRIEQMEPLARAKRLFILSNAAPPEEIEKFISQFLSHLIADHDDYPDCASRLLRYHRAGEYQEQVKREAPKEDFATKDGVTTIPFAALAEMSIGNGDGLVWGQKGAIKNVA